jgi:hypothetical protein
MKGILFFSLLFLIGCKEQPKPPKPQIKYEYIKRSCPKIITLNKPIPREPKRVKLTIKKDINNPNYLLVSKDGLRAASIASQKKTIIIKKQKKYINFYRKQNQKFRKLCN